MRSFQFWILVLGSTLVSLLMMKNVYLTRALNREQSVLVQSQQMASAAPGYENAWKTLAMHIYQQSRSDPALTAILKNAAVQVRSEENPNPDAGTTPAPTTSTPAKAPGTP